MKIAGIDKDISIQELLETINLKHGKRIALQIKKESNWRRLSYLELGDRTIDVSSTLIKSGIGKGERCAILSESGPEWGIAFFGILSCGCIAVPLDIKLKERELENIISHAEPKVIFVSGRYANIAKSLKSKFPFILHIFLLESASDDPDMPSVYSLTYNKGEEKYRSIAEDDTALIVYTSGTTGNPKGVELTLGNLLFEVLSFFKIVSYTNKDNFLSVLPLNHMLEITGGFIAPLYCGATITYCDSLRPNEILRLMKETHSTVMVAVPLLLKLIHSGIFRKIENAPEAVKRSFESSLRMSKLLKKLKINMDRILFNKIHNEFGGHIRCLISGGAPLDPKVASDFGSIGIPVLQGYGLTETAPVVTVNTFAKNKIGSVGRPIPGTELKIVYASGADKEGEILTRGPNIMKGYYKAPDKTAEVIKDGWFQTGDIGYLDEDGYLYISGRSKNLIVTGAGKKVHPEEVEEELSKSPYIKEICVMGKIQKEGSHKGTEEVYAVVVPNLDYLKLKGANTDDASIEAVIANDIRDLSKDMAEYKRVTDFEVWCDELPKTSSRKIKRKEIAELVALEVKEEEMAHV